MAQLNTSTDMVEELVERHGMRREVAERVARSGGVLASRLLGQRNKS